MNEQVTSTFEWQFPGGTTGLTIALIAGLVLVGLSYRFTLVQMPVWARVALTMLRTVTIAGVILCLCRPTLSREIQPDDNVKKRRVAVVFDESASVRLPNIHGNTRLDRAMRFWHDELSGLDDEFELVPFAFSEELRPLDSVRKDAFAVSPDIQKQTHLYQNIAEWTDLFASEEIEAAIVLSDGVDTSHEHRRVAIDALERSALPHVFVPLTQPLPSAPIAEITRLETPSIAPVGTRAPVSVLVQASGLKAGQRMQWQVREGERDLFTRDLGTPGNASITEAVNFEAPIHDKRTHVFEGKLMLDGHTLATVNWSVQGLHDENPRVLLFQGAMDWGTRHLRGVFDREDNAELYVRFHPDAIGQSTTLDTGFPSPRELAAFDVLILLNVNEQQVDATMAETVKAFVDEGGGLLFLNANPVAAGQFAQTPLEQLLPVRFAKALPPSDPISQDTQSLINRFSGRDTPGSFGPVMSYEDSFATRQARTDTAPPLHPFLLTREGAASPVFSFSIEKGKVDPALLPQYQDRASISTPKPGASVLAVAADASSDDPKILLAAQRYGKGRAILLATDPLWRWRLDLSSDSYAYDRFWRQLVAWAAAGRLRQPAWLLDSAIHAPGRAAEVRFRIPPGADAGVEDFDFTVESAQQGIRDLPMAATEDPDVFRTTIVPESDQQYRLVAKRSDKVVAEAYITGRAEVEDEELRALEPDTLALSDLARASRGAVVDEGESFDWRNWLPQPEPEPVRIAQTPVWHTPWIFALLLTAFVLELLIRRRVNLV